MSTVQSIDLNLLRVFAALFEERNVTRAGERLNITQSAVSHALNKLRRSLGDVLFVRGPDGMHPTPRAVELSNMIGGALGQIDAALSRNGFDPAIEQTEYVVGASNYMISTLFAPFMAHIKEIAPGIKIWFRPSNDVNLVEELDRGTLHMAVGVFGTVPNRFVKSHLFAEPFIWAMREDHPAASNENFDFETIAKYRHVDILITRREMASGGGVAAQDGLERAYILSNPPYLDAIFQEKGLKRLTGATVSDILAVPPLLAQTDMISLIPLRFAEFARRAFGLVTREAPYHAPPMTVSMLTHRTMGEHPSIAWLSGALREVVTSEMFK